MQKTILFFLSIALISCGTPKIPVDEIVVANKIYICDSLFSTAEAMALSDSKIVAWGSKDDILKQYATEKISIHEGYIYPGFIDAHSHFYGYGITLNKVDLRNTFSLEDVINKTVEFAKLNDEYWITGRGWDQTDWTQKGNISNNLLNIYFPDRPVFIKRVDGHAAIANNKALELAGITITTKINGGTIEQKNGRLTGLLTDNAMELVDRVIPSPSRSSQISAILRAQENCLKTGLTTVTDAGLDLNTIQLIDSLQKTGDLNIGLYIMANPSQENFDYFKKNGAMSRPRLQVSSFKIYADGALGSRGAKLKAPYCDEENFTGVWVTNPKTIDSLCEQILAMNFQANTHCIGDSANRKVLEIYGKHLKGKNDHRWRIEHAQVVSPLDRSLFASYSIIPSVQPTHATSDMNWALDRLCSDRMKGAYAYRSLLKLNNYLPLGTDFPVEDISPLKTFYAAVYRQNEKNKPIGGFMMNESLSPKEALLGMTRWAAKSNRMEQYIGSLEKGKLADYILLDQDILTDRYMLDTKVLKTVLAN
jgi:predicted amidohydrolase YtcJ